MPEQPFQVAAAIDDAKYKHVVIFDAVNDDILAYGQASVPGPQIFFAGTADAREAAKRQEALCDCVDQAIGGPSQREDLPGAAFQRGVLSSARSRDRPRSFTSRASCRIES